MTNAPEITSLAIITIVTMLMWVPYILESFLRRGFAILGNPSPDDPQPPSWAHRAKCAHQNAVENLVVFAAAVLAANHMGVTGGVVETAATVYVLARLVHYVVYVLGIPVVRTLAFVAGFAATLIIALAALGVI
jgi:uncharacterized MAPEG superfamily protein